MGEMLSKEEVLFERDGEEKLIPKVVSIKGLENKKIKMLPLTRGELKCIRENLALDGQTTKDQDADIIDKKLLEPRFTKKEVTDFSKKGYIDAIIITILEHSCVTIKMGSNVEKAIDKKQEELKKK